MTIALNDFIQQLFSNPVLFITVILTLSVILVNGWTGCPQCHRNLCIDQSYDAKGRYHNGRHL